MPAWDEAATIAAAARVRLALDPRRRRHGPGARLGAGPGASLEFHDHRPYVAGDDLRHLDWGVFARSDQLVMRRHRVEVSPVVEILLDASCSMDAHPGKFALAASCAALIAMAAEADGARLRIHACGDGVRRLGGDGHAGAWRRDLHALVAGGAAGLDQPCARLAAGSERILVSDGLCPVGAAAIIARCGREAGRLCLVQVLARCEWSPQPLGAVRLEDVEGGSLDLLLDDAACAAYRERLQRHQAAWQAGLSGRGAGLVGCLVEDGLPAMLRALLNAGVLEGRA